MRQLFYSSNADKERVHLNDQEFAHCIKVLRKKVGDIIDVIDGRGGYYRCKITNISTKNVEASVISSEFNKKNGYGCHIGISPTKNSDRYEWFVEKSIEFGVSEITFLECDRTERNNLRIDRLEKIALSTIKQSNQYYLPKINNLTNYNEFLSSTDKDTINIIPNLEDETIENICNYMNPGSNICVLIGPEGDFTREEVDSAKEVGYKSVSLGKSRLRTETAGVYCSSLFYYINNE